MDPPFNSRNKKVNKSNEVVNSFLYAAPDNDNDVITVLFIFVSMAYLIRSRDNRIIRDHKSTHLLSNKTSLVRMHHSQVNHSIQKSCLVVTLKT